MAVPTPSFIIIFFFLAVPLVGFSHSLLESTFLDGPFCPSPSCSSFLWSLPWRPRPPLRARLQRHRGGLSVTRRREREKCGTIPLRFFFFVCWLIGFCLFVCCCCCCFFFRDGRVFVAVCWRRSGRRRSSLKNEVPTPLPHPLAPPTDGVYRPRQIPLHLASRGTQLKSRPAVAVGRPLRLLTKKKNPKKKRMMKNWLSIFD